jgi:hypothetical protein
VLRFEHSQLCSNRNEGTCSGCVTIWLNNISAYRVAGGISIVLLAVGLLGVVIPSIVTALFLLIAGISLLAGF